MSFVSIFEQQSEDNEIVKTTLSSTDQGVTIIYDLSITGFDEFYLSAVVHRLIENIENVCKRVGFPIPQHKLAFNILGRQIVELVKNSYDILECHRSAAIKCQITLAVLKHEVRVIYRDFGPGFPVKFLQGKNQIDYRAILLGKDHLQSSKKGQLGGRGLGLARISQLANAFGGELMLQNHDEGGAMLVWNTTTHLTAKEIHEKSPAAVKKHDLVMTALASFAKYQESVAEVKETPEEISVLQGIEQIEQIEFDGEIEMPVVEYDGLSTHQEEDDGFNQREMDVAPKLSGNKFTVFGEPKVETTVVSSDQAPQQLGSGAKPKRLSIIV